MAKVITTLFGELALLPIEATVPCTESLEWKTEVMEHHDGSERREQIRAHPRQTLTYRIAETLSDKIAAYLTQYGALSGNWAVPLWIESQILGATTIGATTIVLPDVSIYDFRDNSLAFLYESASNWQVIEISTVNKNTNTITLTTPLNYFSNARLMPARVGILKAGVSKNSRGHSAISSLKYSITDNGTLLDYDDVQEFLGDDAYFDAPLMNDSYSQSITTRLDDVDFDLGLFETVAPWINNRVIRQAMATTQGADEIRAFKSFIHRRAGKLKQFWEPTFEADLVLNQVGDLTDSIIVEAGDFRAWDKKRNHIAIQDIAGNWTPFQITSVTSHSSSTHTVYLAPNVDLHSSQIALISFLGLKRLNTDLVEINWIGNNTIKSTVSVVEIES